MNYFCDLPAIFKIVFKIGVKIARSLLSRNLSVMGFSDKQKANGRTPKRTARHAIGPKHGLFDGGLLTVIHQSLVLWSCSL